MLVYSGWRYQCTQARVAEYGVATEPALFRTNEGPERIRKVRIYIDRF
jgi:hypothetical protein